MHFLPVWLMITYMDFTLVVLYWSFRLSDPPYQTIHVLCLHLPSSASQSPKRCSELSLLVHQRSTEHCSTITAHDDEPRGARSRITRRQPISGLVSLQHLGGTEASSGLELRQRGGRRLRASAQLWICEFDKKVKDYDARWLKLNLALGMLVFHCCSFWPMVDLHVLTI